MNIKKDEVYTFKIANGDEIVGKVKEFNDNSIVLHQPLTVVPGPKGIQLMPSLFTTELDADITVNRNNIAMIANSSQAVSDSYLEATTGIKPVRNSLLMG